MYFTVQLQISLTVFLESMPMMLIYLCGVSLS